MSKKKVHNISLDADTFKRVKKKRQRIVLQLESNAKDIDVKDMVVFIEDTSNKKCKKKVKKIHNFSSVKDAYSNINKKYLGYKKKDTLDYKDAEKSLSKGAVVGIEVKVNRHIFRKLCLSILILVGIFLSYRYINKFVMGINDKKVISAMNRLAKDKIDYVFIEINPSFALTIKNNKVEDVACLNDDCVAIYNDINLKGKNIDDSIDSLYNLAQKKGFDTSNGVSVKATGNVSIDKKDYITIEYISENTKNELLKELKNNDSIINNNESYYSTLWAELKKDQDYGKVYECSMNGEELECHIKGNMFLNHQAVTIPDIMKVLQNRKDIARVLNKFGIKNEGVDTYIGVYIEVANIYINDIKFECDEDSLCYIDDNEEDYSIEVSFVKAPNGINLLNPNKVLNNLSFVTREYKSYIYDSEGNEKYTYLEKKKYCNLNQENCSMDYYRTCDTDEEYNLSNCKDIDATKYNEITEVIKENEDKWVYCGVADGKLVTKEECYRLMNQNRFN